VSNLKLNITSKILGRERITEGFNSGVKALITAAGHSIESLMFLKNRSFFPYTALVVRFLGGVIRIAKGDC
jgi:hypothetical protein